MTYYLSLFKDLHLVIFLVTFLPFNSKPSFPARQALFRSYGCFFAEFLNELSLVHLGLLDLPTCVGLRYVHAENNLRGFSRLLAHSDWQ